MFGLQHLNLQGHRQAVRRPAIAQTQQGFTAFEHRPAGQRLQAVEVGEPGTVRVNRPVTPQRLDAFPGRGICHHRLGFDARADRIGNIGLERRIGPGVASDQITAFSAQFGLAEQQGGHGPWIAHRPGQRPTPAADTVVSRRGAEHSATDVMR